MMVKPRAIALFSGGLDSALAVCMLQDQGFEVEGLHVRTLFACCQGPAASLAQQLGIPLHVVSVGDDYLGLIRRPRYGYGKGMNPCVDCRIYMARLARRLMEQRGAEVVISGEVLGQRNMSQKRVDLEVIARESGLGGRLLRPLSARRLPPTLAEEKGLVDRSRLGDLAGRSRKPQLALAQRFGLRSVPAPSSGCALADVRFARRVRDLVEHHPCPSWADYRLLRIGRHIRLDSQTKVVLGRNAEQNRALESLALLPELGRPGLAVPADFPGPSALILGPLTPEVVGRVGALVLHFARRSQPGTLRLITTEHPTGRGCRAEPRPAGMLVNSDSSGELL